MSITESNLQRNEAVLKALDQMILSASGWRKIFAADDDENSMISQINQIDYLIAAAAAYSFAHFIKQQKNKSTILLGQDSRPTGPVLSLIIHRTLETCGLTVENAGCITIPELLAATKENHRIDGFFYISASHNPSGYNGFKFGLSDGAIIGGQLSNDMIKFFKETLLNRPDDFLSVFSKLDFSTPLSLNPAVKADCYQTYLNFLEKTACGSSQPKDFLTLKQTLQQAIKERPLSVIIDFNGSSRLLSCDREYLDQFGVKVQAFNTDLGQFNHRIVPEGESLEPCRLLLEQEARQDTAYQLGFLPDCDGDRGNLVIFDQHTQQATILEAQTVFALCSLSELAYLKRLGYDMSKTAIVCNDATSLRITAIAKAFGAQVFVAETGEANVVSRAEQARAEGFTVRLLGEGSNGGNITYPAVVRDPINTLTSIIKLLYLKEDQQGPGLMQLWMQSINKPYQPNFSIAEIVASLPAFTTTSVFEGDALIKTLKKPAELKNSFDALFVEFWPRFKNILSPLTIESHEQLNYEGTKIYQGVGNRHGEESGGLKVVLLDDKHETKGFLWLRGSKTEPITRLMVDLATSDESLEKETRKILYELIAMADK